MQYEFQTEARRMLDLMIHSVYSNTDIFLRELISNASDAIDKRRVESLRSDEITMPSEPKIRIDVDRENRTLSIVDNGIGMNREEIVANIGTIARSGTSEFAAALAESKQKGDAVGADLIGRFGVGFYAAFMVADRVELITRRAGEEDAWRWESTGDGTYTIDEAAKPEAGTIVTLHLKETGENMPDYTAEWQIRSIVKQYSDFVSHPIVMLVEKEQESEGEKPEGVVDAAGKIIVEEQINSQKAIWRRRAEEIEAEEYEEFYRNAFYDAAAPLETIHMRAEGMQEYYGLLYIPTRAPFDIYSPDADRGVKLYVKRVFIMDDAKELVPTWLRFLRGVVDSEDLPLNISREILQQNRAVRAIRSRLTKKTLETLTELLANDREKYILFWNELGAVLKEGLVQEPEQKDAILKASLFTSTTAEGPTTLTEYIERMPESQEAIYYLAGEEGAVVMNSPHLEAFREKGYEVLLLDDRVDAIWAPMIADFEGKPMKSVTAADADIRTEEEKKEAEKSRKKATQELGPMLAKITEILGDYISEVRLSNRLRDSPAVVVTPEGAMNAAMERVMRSMGQEVPPTKRLLELNPEHPVVRKMSDAFGSDPESADLVRLARLVHGGALLAEGELPPDPTEYGRLVAEVAA